MPLKWYIVVRCTYEFHWCTTIAANRFVVQWNSKHSSVDDNYSMQLQQQQPLNCSGSNTKSRTNEREGKITKEITKSSIFPQRTIAQSIANAIKLLIFFNWNAAGKANGIRQLCISFNSHVTSCQMSTKLRSSIDCIARARARAFIV